MKLVKHLGANRSYTVSRKKKIIWNDTLLDINMSHDLPKTIKFATKSSKHTAAHSPETAACAACHHGIKYLSKANTKIV